MRYLTILLLLLFATAPATAQHDYKVSRKHLRDGDFEKALEVLQTRLAKEPDDSEWVYQSAAALAGLGKLDDANAAVAKARKMGVSVGRFAADAHNLFKPLVGSAEFDALVKQVADVPIQGPMIGRVTSSSVGVWLRTAGPAEVKVRVLDAAGNAIQSDALKTNQAADYTAVIVVTGLKPDTQYSYGIEQNSKVVKLAKPLRFRTAPIAGSPVEFSYAFGGGAGYVPQHERMWSTIESFRPDALFLLGDNMYSDDPTSREMQKFCYYRRQSPAEFRQLVGHTPVYSIWDDHDFGTNDCSGGPAVDSPAWKIPVWNVYKQNWVNPGYGGGEQRPGCWYDFQYGDVHFIMLDGRYYRDQKGKTMLGPHQKEWLKQTLAGSKAKFKMIASPVPWEYRTKGQSKDTWNGFQEERKELFGFLSEKKISGVLLMSADRHRSDAWAIERPNGYTLYEFNSSRLTNNHVHGTMKEAIFSYNKKQSFGLVEFNTKLADPQVTYTAVNIDGEKIDAVTVKLSQLQ